MSRFKIETIAPLRPEEATYRPDIYSRKGRKLSMKQNDLYALVWNMKIISFF